MKAPRGVCFGLQVMRFPGFGSLLCCGRGWHRRAGLRERERLLHPSDLERERQAGNDERREEDRQDPLALAVEADELAIGHLKRELSARVAAFPDLQGVTSGFDRRLEGVVQCERPDALAVHKDLERATMDLRTDRLSR